MAKPIRQFALRDYGKDGWTPDRLPEDLSGRTFVITGGNSGIGLEAARLLGRRCARVVLLCRDLEKAQDALDDLHRTSPANCDYSVIECDLADLSSIARAAEQVRTRHDAIDGLINNAGIMMVPERRETRDGFELQFGTNHLGHFALSALLSDRVEAAGGRFVTISSIAHRGAKGFAFDDIGLKGGYGAQRAYAQSKLANLSFALELQRRLSLNGCAAMSIACHPGISDTNIAVTGPSATMRFALMPVVAIFSQTAQRGAHPSALAAAGREAEPGAYYGPTGWREISGRLDRAKIAPAALDEDAARRLWAMSEAMTGVTWPIFQY